MKLKKLLSLTLVAALTLSLSACGAKESSNEGDDGTFVIGGLGPITGEAASYGNSVKQGAQIAIDEINEAGGVKVGDKSYKLKLDFEDDEASPDKVLNAYNTLADKGINALLGCVTSGACLAVINETKKDNILQVTPSGSAEGCTEFDNTFRLCFTDPVQGETMAEYLVNTLGIKNIAVIYNNSDEYSKGIRDVFEAKVAEKGGKISSSESFKTGDVDMKTQLTKIKGTDAEAIFVPAYYNDAANITKQSNDLGMKLPFYGSDGWDGVIGAVTDTAVVEGAVFLSPFVSTDEDPAIQKFVETYKKNNNADPDQFAADGYDSVKVIAAAMEKAGSIESDAMIAAMTEIEVNGLTGKVTFTKDGEPNKEAKFVTIEDGKYLALK